MKGNSETRFSSMRSHSRDFHMLYLQDRVGMRSHSAEPIRF